MSEEFDVALQMPSTESGAEAAAVTHRHGASSAPAGDNPLVAPSDSTTAIRDQRVISESTRKAIAKIAAAGKAADAIDLGDDLVPMGADDAPAKAPVAAKPVTAVAPVEEPVVAAAQAAAAEIMARAEVDKLRGEHDTRVKALETREAKLVAREKLMPDRAQFAERPAAAIAAVLRHALGLGEKDDVELKEAISDWVTESSMEHLGVTLPPEVKTALEARKAVRSNKALRRDIEQREAELVERREANAKADKEANDQREAAGREREAIKLVARLTGEAKDSHPFLHAAGELGLIEDPSAIVVELIRAQRARGESADFGAAIKLANDHFRPKVEAAIKKSAGLSTRLNPAAPAGSSAAAATAAVAAPASQQVGDQVRRPTTLTTTPTAATTDPGTDDGPETEDRYDRRHRNARALLAKHRHRFNAAES